jgi:hypothetical protein
MMTLERLKTAVEMLWLCCFPSAIGSRGSSRSPLSSSSILVSLFGYLAVALNDEANVEL